MASLKAIIFDVDGTLADTEEIHRQAFNRAFTEFRMDWQWSPQEYHELLLVSGGRERIERYLRYKGVEADTRRRRRLARSIHERKSEIYRELLTGAGIRLRPGVERLIREAARLRLKLGIATSSSRRNVETLLETALGAGGIDLFEAVVTCDVVEDKKPSPTVYQQVLDRLGLLPAECVAIEDTRNGNLAALAAGITTVITTHAYTVDNDFRGAALVVDQLGEPESPFRVLQGDADGAGCVDVPLLRTLVSRAAAEAAAWEQQPALAAGNLE
jgi:HAD superfamily hydrolase (TIGR01509 family)